MPGFQRLSQQAIESELSAVVRRWSLPAPAAQDFSGWAWVVASACDAFASEDLVACQELLTAEASALQRIVSERQRLVPGPPPPELLQKQEFLSFLGREVSARPSPRAAA